MAPERLSAATCVVRNTAAHKGRTLAVAPGNAPTRFLHYGRIRLDAKYVFETTCQWQRKQSDAAVKIHGRLTARVLKRKIK